MEKLIKNWINQSNIPNHQKKYVYYYIKYNINELQEFKVQKKTIIMKLANQQQQKNNCMTDLNEHNQEINYEIYVDLQKPLIYSTINGEYIGYYTGNEEKGYKYFIFII